MNIEEITKEFYAEALEESQCIALLILNITLISLYLYERL